MSYADPTFANPCPDLTDDEYADLKAKIERQGFLPAYPVIKSSGPARKGEVVDGFHRLKVCAELGIDPCIVLVGFETEAEFLLEQIDANLTRRQLNKDQRIRLVLKRRDLVGTIESAARTRQGTRTDLGANLPESFPGSGTSGEVRDLLGKMAGVSGRTFEKHAAVIESGDETLNAELSAGRMSTDAAYRRLMEQRDAAIATQSEAEREIDEIHHTPTKRPQPDQVQERVVGEALRRAVDLVKYLRQHPVTDQDVLEYRSRAHTTAGVLRELADWSDLVAATLELNRP